MNRKGNQLVGQMNGKCNNVCNKIITKERDNDTIEKQRWILNVISASKKLLYKEYVLISNF